ncbi:MAG TPA: 2-oxoacid:acceptor oxidoreductase family protein [Polyangia bacterium]|jgi:pyruvate ferredoxin oxidoreductase gamma subunit
MHEIRFHGRGGQGAVTSTELLALAAISEGKYAQAFPSFGPERRGAPVIAFARIAEEAIRNRTAVREPGAVVVLDPSLLRLVTVDEGLTPGGVIVVNSSRSARELRLQAGLHARLAVVDANRIAHEELGRVITNTTMLGALLAAVPLVSPAELERAIEERFGPLAPRNIKAFRRALRETVVTAAERTESAAAVALG